MTPEFRPFPKMARLSRECYVTEKIDGTNASIFIEPKPVIGSDISKVTAITDDFLIYAGSRTRWITPQDDNFGFAQWVKEHATELVALGAGHHFGEWWGSGIQRNYGFKNGERFFSLFNAGRWVEHDMPVEVASVSWDYKTKEMRTKMQEHAPACCKVVPVLDRCLFDDTYDDVPVADSALRFLEKYGSVAAAGFMNPEGIIVYHVAAGIGFKKTIEDDYKPKGKHE
jgi:hypothetical protein